ncbi:MAG: histidine--tRNA ligase [Deltaproteobacteria bacterium]|nr:MAG: histidine--tRNA ligase [Deltaproteobacteria bacterium]
MEVKAVRGFADILPEEVPTWRKVEEEARRTLEAFGFQEIRVPVLERTELFQRGIGDETDIVQKEMYTFEDRGGDSVTLRPEATASIARAYVEHRLYARDSEARLYFIGPMFRYERPQKGRLRQFHQIDAEVFGVDHPMVDAEVMALLMELLKRVGVQQCELQLNSLGCPSCRGPFRRELQDFLQRRLDELCPDCRRRAQSNPLRTFDCKVPQCRKVMEEAPLLEDHLCDACRGHFERVRAHLEELGIPFVVNPRMVRGLDYYTRTAFEVVAEGLGAQNAVAAGGRYDRLVSELGGPDIPGIGFAIGMERLLLLIPPEPAPPTALLFIAALGEEAQRMAFRWSWALKLQGLPTMVDYRGRSLKAQLRRADKFAIPFVAIVGEDEIAQGQVILRDMKKGTQERVPLQGFPEEVLKRLL